MIGRVFRKVFGSRNERVIKKYMQVVEQINSLEGGIAALSDDELKNKTTEFRERLEAGEELDALLPEAFAVVREAGVRALGMRHFDVQLVGGMVLHEGKIAEMRTGEGKTLVSTLAAYLNALPKRGVHVVTVNDYLASRDAQWMAKLHNFLGLSVGVVIAGMDHEEKQAAYACDITYGTNSMYGFDYLRDNMAFSTEQKYQKQHAFAIVDEVDSILIDEARTPLIISGPAEESSESYYAINNLIPNLVKQEEEEGPGDYSVEEKTKQVFLTEDGHQKVENLLIKDGLLKEEESLYDSANISLMHHVTSALRAHVLFTKDVDYIVQNNEIVIVDEFTGRTMADRRWSDGLHQAVEAKEGVPIQQENQTLASITYQNYFRMYEKLSGMTGTADTEAFELMQIYKLEVVVIPTHRPMARADLGDQIYVSTREKYMAVVEDIIDCQKRGQPVLVGTTSIEVSEFLSKNLKKANIKHEVLNAKQHEREAEIVALAGSPGAVTIATNMAGRGTDIVLGGNLDVEIESLKDKSDSKLESVRAEWATRHQNVLDSGGLHIIGTERHESRRIDNQLRGRAGRQGDPGSSRFYLSMEDNLLRIFIPEGVANLIKRGMQEGEAIEHKMVSRSIANAQKKVEGHNFDIRKNLLEFDDVANQQRTEIYATRNEIMDSDDISEMIDAVRGDVVKGVIDTFIPPQSLEEQWDISGLQTAIHGEFDLKLDIESWLAQDDSLNEQSIREKILAEIKSAYALKEEKYGAAVMRQIEKKLILELLDTQWKDHLTTIDQLRQGIQLRSYAQKNPMQEYKVESHSLFFEMVERFKTEFITILTKIEIRHPDEVASEQRQLDESTMQFRQEQHSAAAKENDEEHKPYVRGEQKVGRNQACPCGSGKKYKQCHGKLS